MSLSYPTSSAPLILISSSANGSKSQRINFNEFSKSFTSPVRNDTVLLGHFQRQGREGSQRTGHESAFHIWMSFRLITPTPDPTYTPLRLLFLSFYRPSPLFFSPSLDSFKTFLSGTYSSAKPLAS